MKNKTFLILFSLFGISQSQASPLNIKIQEIKQFAHVDGYDQNGNFKGINIYEAKIKLKNQNIQIGFSLEEKKHVKNVFLGNINTTSTEASKNIDVTEKWLLQNNISSQEVKQKIIKKITEKIDNKEI